jgi:hypothetical protein
MNNHFGSSSADSEQLYGRAGIYAAMPKQPLRITATMRSPIAAVHPWISLDGLLALAAFKDIFYEDWQDRMGCPANDLTPIPLPVTVMDPDSDKWYWAASMGIYDYTESTVRFRKRWDEGHDDAVGFNPRHKPRIQFDGLHFKAKDLPIVIRSTWEIVWFANGNPEEVDRLLAGYITNIGKHGNVGYGRVGSFEVAAVDSDMSCYIDGNPSRPIPCDPAWIDPDRRVELCGFRPPYWAPQNQTLCYMP